MPQVPGRSGEDVAAVVGDEEHPLPGIDHLHTGDRQALHPADAAQQLLDTTEGLSARRCCVRFRRSGRQSGRDGKDDGGEGM